MLHILDSELQMKVQGRSLDELPYKANTGVLGAYYGLIMNVAVLALQFWLAVWPIGGKPDATYFLNNIWLLSWCLPFT